jgi:tetratricopeptide (TPR) repeat protein
LLPLEFAFSGVIYCPVKKIPALLSRTFPLLIILLVGVLCYSNTFNSPFQLDEKYFIEENPLVKDLNYYGDPAKAEGLKWHGALKTRYMAFLSFALNYKLHGFDVTGYHIVNLSIHILNSSLVYFLVLLAFRTPFLGRSPLAGRSTLVALFAALLFVSHPLQTEAVTYVYQRLASLAAFFCLLSLVAYARSRLSQGRARRYALYLVSVGSAVLAMKTKENAFTLPVMIMLFEFLFFKGPVKGRVLRLLPLMLTLLIIPLSLTATAGISSSGATVPRGNIAATRWEYLLTQFTAVATYLRLLFLPVNQNLDYDYPLYGSFLQPRVFLSFLLVLSVIGAGLYLLYRSRDKSPELRLMSFGVFWFFVALSVESSIIPLHTLMNEYRVYLPGAGAFVAFSVGVFLLASKIPRSRTRSAVFVFLFLIPVVLAGASYARNRVWRSEVGMWEDVVGKSPGSARGHQNLGNAYASSGRFEEAIGHYLISLSIKPANFDVVINLADVYFDAGRIEKAAEQFERALDLSEHYPPGLISVEDIEKVNYNLGVSYYTLGQADRAIESYLNALKLNPGNSAAYNNLGAVYFEKGRTGRAISIYHEALRADPGNAAAYINLGEAYLKKNMPDKAIENIEVYLRLSPADPDANRMLKAAREARRRHGKPVESPGRR